MCLKPMGLDGNAVQSSIRISFGKNISRSDIDYAVEAIEKSVAKLRSISALTKAGRK